MIGSYEITEKILKIANLTKRFEDHNIDLVFILELRQEQKWVYCVSVLFSQWGSDRNLES